MNWRETSRKEEASEEKVMSPGFSIFVKYESEGGELVRKGYAGGRVRGPYVKGVYDTPEEVRDLVEAQFNEGKQIAWYLPSGSDTAGTELHLGAVMDSELHQKLDVNNRHYRVPKGRAWKRRNRGIQRRTR